MSEMVANCLKDIEDNFYQTLFCVRFSFISLIMAEDEFFYTEKIWLTWNHTKNSRSRRKMAKPGQHFIHQKWKESAEDDESVVK